MTDPMCVWCEKGHNGSVAGVFRKAHRIVPKVGGLCYDHFVQWQREQIAPPAPEIPRQEIAAEIPPKEETKVTKLENLSKLDDSKIAKIRELAGQGLTISQIARTVGVSWFVAKKYSGTGDAPKKAPAKAIAEKLATKTVRGNWNLGPNYDAVLADLIAKRDKLNGVIATLQELGT